MISRRFSTVPKQLQSSNVFKAFCKETTKPSSNLVTEQPNVHCENSDRVRKQKWRKHNDWTFSENKKKNRAPPGPVEFESLTAKSPIHSDLPFAFRYTYTEVPKIAPVKFQEPFSPFGPNRLDRVWDGQQALPISSVVSIEDEDQHELKSKQHIKGVKQITAPMPRRKPGVARTREEILGEPLSKDEIKELVEGSIKTRRQINLGRDGLTHNMLIEVNDHWKRECVVRIKCKGVPTVDMENVLFQIEDKTGGKIIHRHGGTLYLFRGRNYSYKNRPLIPPMLWRPHSPIYPRLITEAPGGLKVHEANALRKRGLKIMPLCKLCRNGYYGDLVRHVREQFEEDDLIRIDCKGLNPSDYKRIGAKLRDLVPCILLSFDKEQVVLWKGKDNTLSSTVQSELQTQQNTCIGGPHDVDTDSKDLSSVPVPVHEDIIADSAGNCKCSEDSNDASDESEVFNDCFVEGLEEPCNNDGRIDSD